MSAERLEQYLAERRRDHRHYFSAIGIGPLLGFVRDLGIAPMGVRSPLTHGAGGRRHPSQLPAPKCPARLC